MAQNPKKIPAHNELIRVGERQFSIAELGRLTLETRSRRGQRQSELAALLGTNSSQLSRLENGNLKPSGTLLARLVVYLFPEQRPQFSSASQAANYAMVGFAKLFLDLLEQEGLPAAERQELLGLVLEYIAGHRTVLGAEPARSLNSK